MAAIPLYHQQQLESSRVGVPAMDESGNAMAQSILNNSHTLANAALGAQGQAVGIAASQANQDTGMAIQELQQFQYQNEVARKQAIAKQAAFAKEQAIKLNNHDIENHVHRYTMDATDVIDSINANQAIPPEKRPQIIRQSLDGLRKQYTDNHSMNSDVNAGFTKGTDGQIESEYQKSVSAVNTFRTQQAMDLQKDTEQKMVQHTKTFDDYASLVQALNTPGQRNNFFGLHGTKAATAQTAVLKGAAENVFYNTVFQDPINAKKMIEQDAFGKDIFDGKEKVQMANTANSKIEENIRTQESTDKVLAQLGKSAINKIYGDAIDKPDATGYAAEIHQIDTIVKAEQKKPVYGPGHSNENVVNFGLSRMEQLRKRKTDNELAASAARAAAAQGRSAIAAEHSATVWDRQEAAQALRDKIAQAPNQDLLLRAHTSTKLAMDMTVPTSKLDVGSKLSMLDEAFTQLNNAHDQHLIPDKEWQDRQSGITARQQEIQRTLKPSTGFNAWRDKTFGDPVQNKYNELITNGASKDVLAARGAVDNTSRKLATDSEHAYMVREGVRLFKEQNPGQTPNLQQLENIENVATSRMIRSAHARK